MKKRILLFLLLLLFLPLSKVKAVNLSYQSHVQQKGWMSNVKEGSTSGTTGLGLRMESIKISVSNSPYTGTIKYETHVQNYGWMPIKSNGEISGTTGKGLRVEAIKISLTDELSKYYSISYRTHVQQKGWMSWVSDGEISGTTGQRLRVEAIEIKLVLKEVDESGEPTITYSSHNDSGWQNYVPNGEISGTTGQKKKIDQIKIKTKNISDSFTYQTYDNVNGWSDLVNNDEISGKQNAGIEAIKINLPESLKDTYDIYYRVHIQTYGWLSWTKNGNPAGSIGLYKNIEAIQIKMLPKDNGEITINDSGAFMEVNAKINYSSHVQGIGWQKSVSDGNTSGTTGQGKRLESFIINLESNVTGDIIIQSYVEKRGWSKESKQGEISGTTGLGRRIEAVKISLTGNLSNYYDIYYRTHVAYVDWLSWAKNGEISGALNSNGRIEAIEIKLVSKGIQFTGDKSRTYVNGSWKNNNTNYYDYFGNKATGFKLIDGIKYYFNSEGKMYGKDVQKIIDVSSWQEKIDWDTIKKDEDVDAAIIRVGWGTSYNDPCGLDSYFDRNIKEVQRLGIPYGVYIYAYAETKEAAKKEADFVVSKMKQYNMPKGTYVWYDAEIGSIPRSTYNIVIPEFINRVKASGYNNVGVYSGVRQLDTTNGNTNTSTIRSYPIWVSQYYKELQYTGNYKGWQYASDEKINGINGNVDVSMFKK